MYWTDTFVGIVEQKPFINQLTYYKGKKKPDNDRVLTHNVKVPDGCIVDADGFLWSSQCASGEVYRINADNGEIDMVVIVPEDNVTCVTFGGEVYRINADNGEIDMVVIVPE